MGVNKCPHCDGQDVNLKAYGVCYECEDCGAYVSEAGVVAESELRELVEQWRERTDNKLKDIDTTAAHYTGCTGAMCMGIEIAADELEQVLEE